MHPRGPAEDVGVQSGPLRSGLLVLAEGHGRDNLGSVYDSVRRFVGGYSRNPRCRVPSNTIESVQVERIRCFAILTCLAK